MRCMLGVRWHLSEALHFCVPCIKQMPDLRLTVKLLPVADMGSQRRPALSTCRRAPSARRERGAVQAGAAMCAATSTGSPRRQKLLAQDGLLGAVQR